MSKLFLFIRKFSNTNHSNFPGMVVMMFTYLLTAFNPKAWIKFCRDLISIYHFSRAELQTSREMIDAYVVIIQNLHNEKELLQVELRRLQGVNNAKLN